MAATTITTVAPTIPTAATTAAATTAAATTAAATTRKVICKQCDQIGPRLIDNFSFNLAQIPADLLC